jgi:energy-coupling factor transporter ATP-binding protein EcfA2
VLTSLAIRDVVLIERLDLAFGPGLTVLTGETGAGKSILLDSLGLALGMRADSGLVRAGQAQASVAAAFSVAADHPARAILVEQGIEAEDELVLRRVVTADGRSRAFANDQPVGLIGRTRHRCPCQIFAIGGCGRRGVHTGVVGGQIDWSGGTQRRTVNIKIGGFGFIGVGKTQSEQHGAAVRAPAHLLAAAKGL